MARVRCTELRISRSSPSLYGRSMLVDGAYEMLSEEKEREAVRAHEARKIRKAAARLKRRVHA